MNCNFHFLHCIDFVQLMNPACKVAREYPYLPVARFMFLLSETDTAIYPRKFDQSLSYKERFGDFLLQLVSHLGEHTSLFLLRIFILTIVLAVAFIAYVSALYAAVIVVLFLFLSVCPRISTAVYSWWKIIAKMRKRRAGWGRAERSRYAEEADANDLIASNSDSCAALGIEDFVAPRVGIVVDSRPSQGDSAGMGITTIYGRKDYEALFGEHPLLSNAAATNATEEGDGADMRRESGREDGGAGEVSVGPRSLRRLQSFVSADSKASKTMWRKSSRRSFSKENQTEGTATPSETTRGQGQGLGLSQGQEEAKMEAIVMMDFDDEQTLDSLSSHRISLKPSPVPLSTRLLEEKADEVSLSSSSSSSQTRSKKKAASLRDSKRVAVWEDNDEEAKEALDSLGDGRAAGLRGDLRRRDGWSTPSPLRAFLPSTTTRSRRLLSPGAFPSVHKVPLTLESPLAAKRQEMTSPVPTSSPSVPRPESARRTAARNKLREESKMSPLLSASLNSPLLSASHTPSLRSTPPSGPGTSVKEMMLSKSFHPSDRADSKPFIALLFSSEKEVHEEEQEKEVGQEDSKGNEDEEGRDQDRDRDRALGQGQQGDGEQLPDLPSPGYHQAASEALPLLWPAAGEVPLPAIDILFHSDDVSSPMRGAGGRTGRAGQTDPMSLSGSALEASVSSSVGRSGRRVTGARRGRGGQEKGADGRTGPGEESKNSFSSFQSPGRVNRISIAVPRSLHPLTYEASVNLTLTTLPDEKEPSPRENKGD